MAGIKLQYLKEIKRINEGPITIIDALVATVRKNICKTPFPLVVKKAEFHSCTRDPFDHLIVAQARLNEAPLITKDEATHENYTAAIW